MTQLTYDSGFQVNKYGSGDILPSPSLTEEGGERVIMASHRLVAGHLAVWLDAVLQTVELPAGVPHLNTSLAYMDGDALTLKERKKKGWDLERHRAWHWLLLWGLWILQALHAGTWVNYSHTATWWKQKHIWGKKVEVQSTSKRFAAAVTRSHVTVSCAKLMSWKGGRVQLTTEHLTSLYKRQPNSKRLDLWIWSLLLPMALC